MTESFSYDEAADPASQGRFVGDRRPTIPPLVSPTFPLGQELPTVRPPKPSTPPAPPAQAGGAGLPVAPDAMNATNARHAPQAQGSERADQDTPRTLRGAWPPAVAPQERASAGGATGRTEPVGQGRPRVTEPPPPQDQRRDVRIDVGARDPNAPTNIYKLAHYVYQLSVTSVTMDDHELGLLLPRSGRIWFNVKLFNDPPHGRALAQRDAWWRVIDASPAVRFLLGWCVAVFRTAQFDRAPRESLPGRGRVLYFSQPETAPTALRLQFWSDIARDVTEMFAPTARIWRQMQAFTPTPTGDRRWAVRLTMAGYSPQETLAYLADRNNCAVSLIRRTLNGNPTLASYADYQRFTEELLEDLPSLRMQRVMAMQRAGFTPASQRAADRQQTPTHGGPLPNLMRNRWAAAMPDPRQDVHFWQLHL